MQASMAQLVVSTKLTLFFRPFRYVLDSQASSLDVIALTQRLSAASVVTRGEHGTVERGHFICNPATFIIMSLV